MAVRSDRWRSHYVVRAPGGTFHLERSLFDCADCTPFAEARQEMTHLENMDFWNSQWRGRTPAAILPGNRLNTLFDTDYSMNLNGDLDRAQRHGSSGSFGRLLRGKGEGPCVARA